METGKIISLTNLFQQKSIWMENWIYILDI